MTQSTEFSRILQNTGVGSLSLLQGNFQTQELNQGLLHGRRILYQLSYQGSLISFGGKHQILAQASINLQHDTSKLPRAEKQDFFLFSG